MGLTIYFYKLSWSCSKDLSYYHKVMTKEGRIAFNFSRSNYKFQEAAPGMFRDMTPAICYEHSSTLRLWSKRATMQGNYESNSPQYLKTPSNFQ